MMGKGKSAQFFGVLRRIVDPGNQGIFQSVLPVVGFGDLIGGGDDFSDWVTQFRGNKF